MHTTIRRIGSTLGAVTLAATTLLAGPAVPAGAATGEDGVSAPMTCAELWERLPEQLKDDIRAARSLPPEEQHRAMWVIRRAALRGAYGEKVERLAEARRERRHELWESFPEQLREDIRAALSLRFEEQRRAMRAIRVAALEGAYGERIQELAEARVQWLSTCPQVGGSI